MKIKDFDKFCSRIKPELVSTLKNIQANTYWSNTDLIPEDSDLPELMITISCNDNLETWSFQTGDNSYTGSCYGDPYWGIGYMLENSNAEELAESLLDSLAEVITFEYED